MKHLILGFVLAASLLAAAFSPLHAAVPAVPGVTGDRVLLGQSAKLSGSAGTFAGRQYRDGLLLAFEAANRAGGVHGRRIELLTLDDMNIADKALANTRELIDDRRVFALVGYTFTDPVRAALPAIHAARVPLVGAYTGVPELYDGSLPMVYSLRASFDDELAAIVRHIETVGYDRLAMIHYATSVGGRLRDDIQARLAATGRTLSAVGAMPINASDYLAAARQAVQALNARCPKLVILGVSGRDAAAIVQAMAQGACPPAQFIARNIVDIGLLQTALGDAARGIIVTQVVPNPTRGQHPLVVGYRSLLKERDAAGRPDFTEFEGYIAGRVVVTALQRAGRTLDRAAFMRALEATTLEGPGHYRIRFGAGVRAGSRYTNIVMVSDAERITD